MKCMEQGVVTVCDRWVSCCITVVKWKWWSMTAGRGRGIDGTCAVVQISGREERGRYTQLPALRHYSPLSGRTFDSRSQWPRGLRRGSAAARLMGLRFRIPSGSWVSVFCKYCVLSGRSVCFGLTTRPEKTWRMWGVWMWSWNFDEEEALLH